MAESDYENINIEANKYQKIEWLTEEELNNSAISTAMKKVFNLDNFENSKVKSKFRSCLLRAHRHFNFPDYYIIIVPLKFVLGDSKSNASETRA